MELYFLDENFALTEGPVEDMTSVVFSERYFECGTFTLHFPRELVKKIGGAAYVQSGQTASGEVFCGRIEYLICGTDGDCEMGGHLLEILPADRILYGEGPWSGTVTEAVLGAVRANLRNLPMEIGENQAQLPDAVTLSSRWESLSAWLYATLKPYGASYRITLENGTPVFRIVKGEDRSSGVSDQPAIFSASFGNIFAIEMDHRSVSMKNVITVEGRDGTVVTVDESGGGGVREMYQKVTDINPDAFDSEDAYREALMRRGSELLAKHPSATSVSCECDGGALPIYGTDYRLGDICDVVDEELGVTVPLRLTQVDHVTENGRTAVYPVFGEQAWSGNR